MNFAWPAHLKWFFGGFIEKNAPIFQQQTDHKKKLLKLLALVAATLLVALVAASIRSVGCVQQVNNLFHCTQHPRKPIFRRQTHHIKEILKLVTLVAATIISSTSSSYYSFC